MIPSPVTAWIATDCLLDAACRAGDHLAETAYWNADRTQCNWLSHREVSDPEIGPSATRVGTLSAEIYSGTAGVAWFLAELFGATQRAEYRELAVAAWNRSARYFRHFPPPVPPVSFYAGNLGLAYVGVQLLAHCPDLAPALEPEIAWHLAQVGERFTAKHGLDVIGGNAGAIAPLLALAARPGYAHCQALARACGDELVTEAVWADEKCFWPAEKALAMPIKAAPMTGFSHGAAGMALALLELYQATGQPEYLRTARGAFAFEDTFFSSAAGNWLDTRSPHSMGPGEPQGTFRCAWCHGAPGNMLAYLRASYLDAERAGHYRARAAAAAATTAAHLRELAAQPVADATLCHGLCGLADVLLSYGHLLGDEAAVNAALEATEQFVARYPNPAHWPSALANHAGCPSLLTGNAGIGLHLLRAHAHGAGPSALLQIP